MVERTNLWALQASMGMAQNVLPSGIHMPAAAYFGVLPPSATAYGRLPESRCVAQLPAATRSAQSLPLPACGGGGQQ